MTFDLFELLSGEVRVGNGGWRGGFSFSELIEVGDKIIRKALKYLQYIKKNYHNDISHGHPSSIFYRVLTIVGGVYKCLILRKL